MADVTQLQPVTGLNSTETANLISPAVLSAQQGTATDNSTVATSTARVNVGQGVLDAQSASGTDSTAYTNTQQSGLLSPTVTGAQASSNTDQTGFSSSMYGTSQGGPTDNNLGNTLPPVTVTANSISQQKSIPNPLHSYVNYTYSLSLHLLDDQTYNSLGSDPNSYVPSNVLVASAGKYNPANFIRNPSFSEDFYFDELKITTVVNTSSRNKNSNAVDISFTIIEPNGFTFINRLLDACSSAPVHSKNYLMQPYLLQIDFYGYTDAGQPTGTLLDQTKRIPIVMIGMKSKVTSKGAEYRIQAAPYNHRAFTESVARTPANFQIKANSLMTFFGSGGNTNITDLINQRVAAANASSGSRTTTQTPTTTAQTIALLDKVALDQGYVNAMNGWANYLVTSKNRVVADQFDVVLAPEIQSSPGLIDKKKNPTVKVANGANAAASPDWSQGYFQVNAGTTIEAVIEMALRNSDYILNQITDPSTDAPETIAARLTTPLKWFKIVPKVELLGWDPLINDYAKKTTYYVKQWIVNSKHPSGPLGATAGAVKTYNYLYTGQNDDIVDMSIDFDMQYYVQMTVDRNKQQENLDQARIERNDAEASITQVPTPGTVNGMRIVHQSQNAQAMGQFGSSFTAKKQTSADVNQTLNSADMINLKLRIIGDPQFIKQDDVFYNQNEVTQTGPLVNNSLVMDSGELYILVQFQTPIDYNETYGVMSGIDPVTGTQKYSYNLFSGRYALITVDNVFSKGKFEQVLDLVRLPNQEQYDNLTGTATPTGGQSIFRLPDPNQVVFPQLQGFSAAGLPAGTSLAGVVNSLVNSGTGALSGIASSVINSGISLAKTAISNEVNSLVSQGAASVADWWSSPSVSADALGTGGFENVAGGGMNPNLISGEVSGIPGLSSFPSDLPAGDGGALITADISNLGAGTGTLDTGLTGSGLETLPAGVDLGGIF